MIETKPFGHLFMLLDFPRRPKLQRKCRGSFLCITSRFCVDESSAGNKNLERETGFEPATSTLARSHSTTELLPLGSLDYKHAVTSRQRRPHSDKAMLNFDTERPRHKKLGTP